MKRIQVIDSHTGGEPTRIIVGGGPDLGDGPLEVRRRIFSEQFDEIRSAVVNEPRGSDVLVGGLLCPPHDGSNSAGVVFFNAEGFLGMCGHGTIGLMVTLLHLGRIETGPHRIETPVGTIRANIDERGTVSIQNVRSYRFRSGVSIKLPNYGTVTGDIAWGGNWFFLVDGTEEELCVENASHLMNVTTRIRDALSERGITGANDGYIDHIEMYGPPQNIANDSRNFVLCPGNAYDRSPCGTGTSAKMACLAADGRLEPGDVWRQESIIGSLFECSYQPAPNDEGVIPTIVGSAFVSAETTLLLDPRDPYCMGIRS